MKQITKNTTLIQGDKTYQPIEIDGVVYWTRGLVTIMDIGAVVIETLVRGQKILMQIDTANDLDFETQVSIVAQSQPILEGIPVVSLDVMHLAKLNWGNIHRTGVLGFIDGYKSNPNQYTLKDIERAIELSETSGRVDMGFHRGDFYTLAEHKEHVKSKEEILEQINSIQSIEVDENFTILNY